ncbi:hypothetical protein F5141DRAFT_623753 [Pisolithus sp. B1]|nr:hypothetical protein F5141DRAFT_623753 [Pisolithus sp. B1]
MWSLWEAPETPIYLAALSRETSRVPSLTKRRSIEPSIPPRIDVLVSWLSLRLGVEESLRLCKLFPVRRFGMFPKICPYDDSCGREGSLEEVMGGPAWTPNVGERWLWRSRSRVAACLLQHCRASSCNAYKTAMQSISTSVLFVLSNHHSPSLAVAHFPSHQFLALFDTLKRYAALLSAVAKRVYRITPITNVVGLSKCVPHTAAVPSQPCLGGHLYRWQRRLSTGTSDSLFGTTPD